MSDAGAPKVHFDLEEIRGPITIIEQPHSRQYRGTQRRARRHGAGSWIKSSPPRTPRTTTQWLP